MSGAHGESGAPGPPPHPADSERGQRPWLSRAVMYALIAVFVGVLVWRSWKTVSPIVVDVASAAFIALAIEPLVVLLIRHGWNRRAASAACVVGLVAVCGALLAVFGNLFVNQAVSLAHNAPSVYANIADWVSSHTRFTLPGGTSLGNTILTYMKISWMSAVASKAVTVTASLLTATLGVLAVILVSYYLSAAGPRLRIAICQWLGESAQRKFLLISTIAQEQISAYLFFRGILAGLSALCAAIFFSVIQIPYWLPLAIFWGVVSEFVPVVGTYISGALPILIAWGTDGIAPAILVLAYMVVFKQIKNLIVSPKLSQHTMHINPAVSFLSVLALTALFGAIGAFLALPITTSIQEILTISLKRHETVDSPLLSDPVPVGSNKTIWDGRSGRRVS